MPFYQAKVDVVKHLESAVALHPQTTWTAVICGPFFDWVYLPFLLPQILHRTDPLAQCLKQGFYGFDLAAHKATLYDHGTTKFDTTTLSTVGDSVASILSRPDKYANERLYITSFTISQQDILLALERNDPSVKLQTTEASTAEYIQGGHEKIGKGDYSGILDLIFGTTFQKGHGSEYSSGRKISNQELGLEREDLVKVVGEVVQTDRHIVKW